MMRNLFTVILLAALQAISFAAITHSGTVITFSGVETGNTMRGYISANSLGTVTDRTTIVNASIRPLNTAAEFRDNDCTWIFSGAFHWDFTTAANVVEIIDGVMIYTQAAKSHTSQLRATTLKLQNVQYRIEGGTGRTDFFSNGDSGFEFDNVQFITYGGANYLHLPTAGGLLQNVSVRVGSGGLTFQPDCNPGQTLTMLDWTLDANVGSIIPNGGGNLTAVTYLENLDWGNTVWSIDGLGRGQTYIVKNPIKPVGWIRYSGRKSGIDDTYEVHTHNVKVVDVDKNQLTGINLQLRKTDGTLLYSESTDANGDIAEQEIVTFEQTASNVWQQNIDFKLTSVNYLYQTLSGVRALQNGRIDEEITLLIDQNITETDKSVVDAYTSLADLEQVYDRAKSWKVDASNLDYPAPDSLLAYGDNTIVDWVDLDVVIDHTAISALEVNKITGVVTLKSDTLNFADNLRSMKTNGVISAANGGVIQFGYEDNTGTYKFFRINNIDSSTLYVIDITNNDTLFTKDTADGTFSGLFQMPAGNPDIRIDVVRAGYLDWQAVFPDEDLVLERDVFTAAVCEYDKQIEMINLTLKLLQKSEAILNATCDKDNPTLNVTTTTSSDPDAATEVNQDQILQLLLQNLRKTSAIREAQGE